MNENKDFVLWGKILIYLFFSLYSLGHVFRALLFALFSLLPLFNCQIERIVVSAKPNRKMQKVAKFTQKLLL